MIRLNQTNTQLISLITAQNGATVVVSYSDKTSGGYDGNTQVTSITSATTTTICSTPAASTIRDVDHIQVKNTYAGSHTVTVQLSSSAVLYPLVTVALANGDSLEYTHGSGWQVLDANGNRKVSPFSGMTSAQLAGLITDETGSGALVFATSPTLVTPALGTPASGDLRNCSLAVAPAIGGTTPAAGAFTTLSATGLASFTAKANVAGGSVSAPSLYWTDTGTGFYRIGTNNVGYSVAGTKLLDLSAALFAVTGALSCTGNATLGDATTDAHTINGYVGIGGAANSANAITVLSTDLVGVTIRGVNSSITAPSTATTAAVAFNGRVSTAAASFTMIDAYVFNANDAVKGSGSTITNLHGLRIADLTQGSNNYGITSAVSAGANKWNIYASGTANNAFAGNVRIGGTTAPTVACDVTGAIAATTTVKTGGYTVATLPAGAAGMRAYVTDATTPTWLAALTGGGAVVCPVFYNGSAWVSA